MSLGEILLEHSISFTQRLRGAQDTSSPHPPTHPFHSNSMRVWRGSTWLCWFNWKSLPDIAPSPYTLSEEWRSKQRLKWIISMPLMSLNLTKPNTRKYSFMLRGTYINSFKLPFYGLPLLFVRYTRRRLNSKRVKREYLHKEKQQKNCRR